MKHFILLMSVAFLGAGSLHAQNWGEWASLKNTAGVDASVSFKLLTNCTNYSFWRSSLVGEPTKGMLTFSFLYTDCDGKQQREIGTIDLQHPGINQNLGNWFYTRSGDINDIRIDELYMPDKKIWLKRVNGETVDMWKQRYGGGK